MLRLALVASLLPAPAFAHLGHVEEVAGHSHWIGLAAAAGAAALAGWLAIKGRRGTKETKADPQEEPRAEEEPTS